MRARPLPGRRTRVGATVSAVFAVLITIVAACGDDGDDEPDTTTADTVVNFTGSATAELVFGVEVYRFDVACESTGDEEDDRLLMAGAAAPDSPGIGLEASIALQDGRGRAAANLGGEPVRRVELADAEFDRTENGWSTSGAFDEVDRGSVTAGQLIIDGCLPP